jgi:hypothetical protein
MQLLLGHLTATVVGIGLLVAEAEPKGRRMIIAESPGVSFLSNGYQWKRSGRSVALTNRHQCRRLRRGWRCASAREDVSVLQSFALFPHLHDVMLTAPNYGPVDTLHVVCPKIRAGISLFHIRQFPGSSPGCSD